MRMYRYEERLDCRALGAEIKRRRKAKGWTQEHLAQLVDLTPRSVMYIENRGQHAASTPFTSSLPFWIFPWMNFLYPGQAGGENERRKHIDRLLNGMDEKELIIIEGAAEGIRKAGKRRERKKTRPPFFRAMYRERTNGKQFGCGHTPKFLSPQARKNACWGAPRNPLDFGTNCPESSALCAYCLRPVAIAPGPYFPAPVRHAEQMINVRLDRHSLPHIRLGLAVFRIEGFFLSRQFLAGLFHIHHLWQFCPVQKLIHSGPGRPVSGSSASCSDRYFLLYRAAL